MPGKCPHPAPHGLGCRAPGSRLGAKGGRGGRPGSLPKTCTGAADPAPHGKGSGTTEEAETCLFRHFIVNYDYFLSSSIGTRIKSLEQVRVRVSKGLECKNWHWCRRNINAGDRLIPWQKQFVSESSSRRSPRLPRVTDAKTIKKKKRKPRDQAPSPPRAPQRPAHGSSARSHAPRGQARLLGTAPVRSGQRPTGLPARHGRRSPPSSHAHRCGRAAPFSSPVKKKNKLGGCVGLWFVTGRFAFLFLPFYFFFFLLLLQVQSRASAGAGSALLQTDVRHPLVLVAALGAVTGHLRQPLALPGIRVRVLPSGSSTRLVPPSPPTHGPESHPPPDAWHESRGTTARRRPTHRD